MFKFLSSIVSDRLPNLTFNLSSLKDMGVLLYKTAFLKSKVEIYNLVGKHVSKCYEKIILNERNSRNAVIICWIEPNNFSFTSIIP